MIKRNLLASVVLVFSGFFASQALSQTIDCSIGGCNSTTLVALPGQDFNLICPNANNCTNLLVDASAATSGFAVDVGCDTALSCDDVVLLVSEPALQRVRIDCSATSACVDITLQNNSTATNYSVRSRAIDSILEAKLSSSVGGHLEVDCSGGSRTCEGATITADNKTTAEINCGVNCQNITAIMNFNGGSTSDFVCVGSDCPNLIFVDNDVAESDGYAPDYDNCDNVANPTQLDTNADGEGDACDDDDDGDTLLDAVETNSGTWISATDTGTDSLLVDTDADGTNDNLDVFPNDAGATALMLISDIVPGTMTTSGGSTITIAGTSFSDSPIVTVGGNACTVATGSQTLISCTVPEGTGTNKEVRVTRSDAINHAVQTAGISYITSTAFSYAPPTITFVTQNGSTAGSNITISGMSFGASGVPTVTVGGLPCTWISNTHTEIICTTSESSGTNKEVVVTVDGQSHTQDANSKYSFGAPTVTDVSPSASTAGGTTITVTGTNFGIAPDSVTIGGNACAGISGSHTSFTCTLPEGSGVSNNLIVTEAAQTNAVPVLYAYAAPSITNITPQDEPTTGGSLIVISGDSFGTAALVTISGNQCFITNQNHSSITCNLPAGNGSNNDVVVTVDGQINLQNVNSKYSYAAPTISQVLPSVGTEAGGAVVVIEGDNFGDAGATVSMGGNDCVVLPPHDQTSISCTAPAGTAGSASVVVTQSSQSSSGATDFIYLLDTDGDGNPNDCDVTCQNAGMTADSDDDGDGVLDDDDVFPLIDLGGLADTDGNGMPDDCDAVCLALGMYPDADNDGDGITDDKEMAIGTNPNLTDSDGDGMDDDVELLQWCTDPNAQDTDGDGMNDDVDPEPNSNATCTMPLNGLYQGGNYSQGQ